MESSVLKTRWRQASSLYGRIRSRVRADLGVLDVGVGEGLEGFGDRLLVDPVRCVGVVGRLDGQGAAEGVYEERAAAADRDVRVAPGDVRLAARHGPGEVVRGREDVVAVAARVEERAGGTVRGECPAQYADAVGGLAGTEHGEESPVDAAETEQAGVTVVAVQGGEFAYEGFVGEESVPAR